MASRIRVDESDGPAVRHSLSAPHSNDRAGARRGRVARTRASRPTRAPRLPVDRKGRSSRKTGDCRPTCRPRKDSSGVREMLAQALVALAARSFGTRQRLWGQAMQVELHFAIEDGRPLTFALG